MKKYTISAVLNGGLASDDLEASTKDLAFVMLDILKEMTDKCVRCGNMKKGEVIEYMITEWSTDEDGDLVDILDDIYYERVEF